MECRPLEVYISDLCCLPASSCMLSTNQGLLISRYCSVANNSPLKASFIGQLSKVMLYHLSFTLHAHTCTHIHVHTFTLTPTHMHTPNMHTWTLDPRCCNPTLLNEGRIQPSRPSNVRCSVNPWTRQCMSIASFVPLTALSLGARDWGYFTAKLCYSLPVITL